MVPRERLRRIHQIIDETLRKARRGEPVSPDMIVAEHPDLMPELAAELARDLESFEFLQSQAASQLALQLVCPYCHGRMLIEVVSGIETIECESCHQDIRLSAPEVSPRESGEIVGHLRLEEKLGTGAFGEVWRCWDESLERMVAVKFPIRAHLTRDEHERFIGESRAAAQIHHPNVVRVLEFSRDEDCPFIVSEYIDGETLDERCKRPTTYREIAEIVMQIARGLESAHRAGVVHRDLKPQNILIDSAEVPRIVDFGLAKRDTTAVVVTADGRLVGTPAYMSPEHVDRSGLVDVDARSDLFSLGTIFYELLTGALPFAGNQCLDKIADPAFDPIKPRQIVGEVPADLQTICLRCLEKAPNRRLESAARLADELHRYLNGLPLTIRAPSFSEITYRWCRRHPGGAIAYVMTVSFVVALVAGTWNSMRYAAESRELARSAKHNEDRAQREQRLAEERLYELVLSSANAASQRGEWSTALQYLEKARPTRSNSITLKMKMLEAYDALHDMASYDRVLQELKSHPNIGEHEAMLWSRMAESAAYDGRTEDARRLFARSLQRGLPPAEAAYVRAQLAETSPEALRSLRECLSESPFHHRANAQICIELLLLGEFREAESRCESNKLLFPADPLPHIVLGTIDCFRRDLTQAKSRLENTAQISLQTRRHIESAYTAIDLAVSSFDDKSVFVQRTKQLRAASMLVAARPIIDSELRLRIPERFKPLGRVFSPGFWLSRDTSTFEELARIHPVGETLLFAAISHSSGTDIDWIACERYAIQALDAKFLFLRSRSSAVQLSCMAIVANDIGLSENLPKARKLGKNAYARVKSIVNAHWDELNWIAKVRCARWAHAAGDHESADRLYAGILEHGYPIEEADPIREISIAAESALEVGKYARALRLCMMVRSQPGFAESDALAEVESAAISHLSQLVQQAKQHLSEQPASTTNGSQATD